jgi:nucleotide-binding universal stress UspA family protein
MKKILVPTDFSDCADNATEVAAQISRKTGATLCLLHVISIPVYGKANSFEFHSKSAEGIFWMKLAKESFQKLLARPYMKDVNTVEIIQFENVYKTIAAQANEHDIDLLVMGSHGDSGAHEVFIGSNAEKVVRLVDCPVLTIKKRHENFDLNTVIFASNFFGEAKDNFNRLFSFIELFNAKLHLVKINTPVHFETSTYSNQLMDDFIKEWDLKNVEKHIHNERGVQIGLHVMSKELNADLIAMETHGKSGITRFFMGSHTEGVVNHIELPVLSLKIKSFKKDYKPFPSI